MENPLQSDIRPQPREAFGHPVAAQHQHDEKPGHSEDSPTLESEDLTGEEEKMAQFPPYNPGLTPKVSLSERISQQRINQANQ